MKRRDFTIGLALTAAVPPVRSQEQPKQHRIAIVMTAGPVTRASETRDLFWRAFFEELLRLGDVEGQNLTVERYSGEGRPERYADLAQEVVGRHPEAIIANTATAQAVRAATDTIPIVWVGADPIRAGLVANLALPGGNITGVSVDARDRDLGKATADPQRSCLCGDQGRGPGNAFGVANW
jgi:putative ABC transport system substrate-binding protein